MSHPPRTFASNQKDMAIKLKTKILNSIIKVYDETEDCDMKSDCLQEVDTELTILSDYFQTTKNQALFIAIIFGENYNGHSVGERRIGKFLFTNPIKILEYSEEIDQLISQEILVKEEKTSRIANSESNTFEINEKVIEAIVQSKPVPNLKSGKFQNALQLLERIDKMCDDRRYGKITTVDLIRKSSSFIENNEHFILIQKIKPLGLKRYDTFLFLYIIWQVINGDQQTVLGRTLEGIFDDANQRINYMHRFFDGSNKLLKNKWIELDKSNFFNNTCASLSEKSIDLLREAGIHLFTDDVKNDHILKPESIPQRKLIFSETEMKQIFLIKDLLKPEQLNEMQERLSCKNMPKGITVLLHGAPGTGKTEIVKQLARETGRDLMKIDISQSKSMWFGESEKIVKRFFTDYKAYAKKSKAIPILFFNEADAILSKRQNTGASNVAQTENAIQNILLEEIENFEGILFATTNLIVNLDNAFDRRFLFKIHFPKPSIDIKAQIWKLKIPALSNAECESLAAQFDFTGGQIDNIVRKSEMREILYGESVGYQRALDFCMEENFGEERLRIGF